MTLSNAVWSSDQVKRSLPLRQDSSHKGTYGTALLLAGSKDMPGAALLSGLGAMRSGLGKLELATEAEVIPMVVSQLPETTYLRDGLKLLAANELELSAYRAAAIGPGVLPDEHCEEAIRHLLASELPLILDAGALSERNYPKRGAPVILTPHPGEFTRITLTDPKQLTENRRELASEWAQKLGVTIVLKGKPTIVAFPEGETWRNPTGNSALAKGGTGDTLTGMMLGMLCCHDNWKHAVLNAVYLHGACADKWVETGSPHTLLAHELTGLLPSVWKEFE